jgi:hypothetical protein
MYTFIKKLILVLFIFEGLISGNLIGQISTTMYVPIAGTSLTEVEVQDSIYKVNPHVTGILISNNAITLMGQDSIAIITYRVIRIEKADLLSYTYVCENGSQFYISHMFLEPEVLTRIAHYVEGKIVKYY